MKNLFIFYGTLFLAVLASWLSGIWYLWAGITGMKMSMLIGAIILIFWLFVCLFKSKWRSVLDDVLIAIFIYLMAVSLILSKIITG